MKKSFLALGIALAALTSCKQFKKGPAGDMLYKIYEDKTSPLIKEGDFVSIQAVEKTEEDSVLFSSYEFDRPSLLVRQKSIFKGDLFEALGMLSEGDSATFKISIDSMEKKMQKPKPKNTKGKYLVYDIKVLKVIPKGKLDDQAFKTKLNEYMVVEMQKAKNNEGGRINGYISKKDLKSKIKVTSSGLNYIVDKEGAGQKPVAGDTVSLNYKGYLLSGKVFDTTLPDEAKKAGLFTAGRPYEPLKVPVGGNSTIPGFDEALMLFNKGTKATVIIPSKLAYGEKGNPSIPPYTPLVFDITIENVVPNRAGAPNVQILPSAPPAPQTSSQK